MPRILLVDDDVHGLESTRKILELSRHSVVTAEDGSSALEKVRSEGPFDLVVTDVRMPRLGGIEFLRALTVLGTGTPVILMTAFGRVEDAVWAMKLGAVDFLTKPFKRQALTEAVESALKRAHPRTAAESKAAGKEAASSADLPRLIGASSAMGKLRNEIERVAPTSTTVLIQGESGTGKERVARMLHDLSPRSRKPFIALNCAAVPEHLIESELFGAEKGAFTGATSARTGLFEAADGGTLLLDEIGDMPLALQAKLLRVLQEGEVRRVGATASRRVDVRVIAATHRDLRAAAASGVFRQDLLFRLEVITLQVPALRDRAGDVEALARYFLLEASQRHGKGPEGFAPEALGALLAHSWPGNVRELANVIERAVVFSSSEKIELADLPPHIVGQVAGDKHPDMLSIKVGTSLEEVEELLIRKTLEATDGDKNMTARLLGVNPRTIYRKLDPKRQ